MVPSTPKVDWAELSDDERALTEQLGYNAASFAETAPPILRGGAHGPSAPLALEEDRAQKTRALDVNHAVEPPATSPVFTPSSSPGSGGRRADDEEGGHAEARRLDFSDRGRRGPGSHFPAGRAFAFWDPYICV
jgi:hypothetical protein